MSKKTICFISPKFSDFIGGMETHATDMVAFFIKNKNYKITSILTRSSIDDGVPSPKKCENVKLKAIIKPILEGNFIDDAKKIVESSNPTKDIYYLNSPNWLPAMEIIKKQFPKSRIIVRSGGNDIMAGWIGSEKDSSMSLESSKRYLVELINTYVEKFIVNSDYSLKRAISAGIKKEKIVKIIGGVDCSRFKPRKKEISKEKYLEIVTVARFVKFKGIIYSLRAVQKAIQKFGINIKYTIIGDGPEKENLKNEANNLGISKNVFFKGAVNLEEVPKYIETKDIFLHLPIHLEKTERGSSYIHTETMGRCLCEAEACGIPIITSKVGGIPEIVEEGITGFLLEEKDYS
ncbi:MAG: glycosyltransferase family 4 protein, partial [Candidatus Pacearchaeota archaeon]